MQSLARPACIGNGNDARRVASLVVRFISGFELTVISGWVTVKVKGAVIDSGCFAREQPSIEKRPAI